MEIQLRTPLSEASIAEWAGNFEHAARLFIRDAYERWKVGATIDAENAMYHAKICLIPLQKDLSSSILGLINDDIGENALQEFVQYFEDSLKQKLTGLDVYEKFSRDLNNMGISFLTKDYDQSFIAFQILGNQLIARSYRKDKAWYDIGRKYQVLLSKTETKDLFHDFKMDNINNIGKSFILLSFKDPDLNFCFSKDTSTEVYGRFNKSNFAAIEDILHIFDLF